MEHQLDQYVRWNALLELLTERGRIGVEEAAERLGVSKATIRRDFDQLARQRMITRTRGGAHASGISSDLPLRYKTARQVEEKRRIGAVAAALVEPGMTVGLNGGTTTTEVARALAARPDLTGDHDRGRLTVVTNALTIANELLNRSNIQVVITGGVVRPRSLELVGPLGEGAVLAETTLDMALLGVDAIDVMLGAAAHNEGEAAVNSLMAARARMVVIIADRSKLCSSAFARICPTERVATLVTDAGADHSAIQAFIDAGVEVVTA